MSPESSVAVWSAWRLHADAVVAALAARGVRASATDEPVGAEGLLVADAVAPDLPTVLGHRRRDGRATVVWGGTLPIPRVVALREAGADAYVPMLWSPAQVEGVVSHVLAGGQMPWPEYNGTQVSLTRREREVAEAYLVTWPDATQTEVAANLSISVHTLKVHLANIRAKTGHRGTSTREGLRRHLMVRGWLV